MARLVATREPTARTTPRLWTRDLSYYATARLVSLFGDAMLPIGLMAAVLALGYGATGIGLVLAAEMLPFALLVLFGGVLADRFTPRPMMVGADAVRLGLQVFTGVVLLVGHPALWLLMALSAVSGAATAMFQPGVASLVPQVSQDVQRANGVLRIAEAFASIAGPTIAAVVIAVAGVPAVFWANAATYAVSAVCLLMLRLAPATRHAAAESMVHRLRAGWREFRSRTWLWMVIVAWVVAGITMFGPIRPLTAVLIVGQHGTSALGLVWAMFGAGNLLGGLAAMRIRPRRPLAAGAAAMLAWMLMPLANAAALPLWGVAVCFLIGGACWAFWSVMWATTVQTKVPADLLNRLYAYDVAGSIIAIPIGQALAGPVSDLLGARTAQAGSAAIGVALFALLLCVPAVRRLTR
jgi:MFS family permease